MLRGRHVIFCAVFFGAGGTAFSGSSALYCNSRGAS